MQCPSCFAEKSDVSLCPNCGGFGITYLGWDIQLKIKVAIKEFLPRDLVGRNIDRVSKVA